MSDFSERRHIEPISQLPDGAGPVIACTMFHGMLLAATEKGVYCLDGDEWRRVVIVRRRKGEDG